MHTVEQLPQTREEATARTAAILDVPYHSGSTVDKQAWKLDAVFELGSVWSNLLQPGLHAPAAARPYPAEPVLWWLFFKRYLVRFRDPRILSAAIAKMWVEKQIQVFAI